MEENRKGFIIPISEVAPHEHGVGHNPHHVQVYRFVRSSTEALNGGGKEPSKHITLFLLRFETGGGFDENYRENNAEMPIFDMVYYVISGRVRFTLGEIEKTVGADTVIYCPSNVKHSMINVGKSLAKLIMVSGSGEGEKMGAPVYTKKKAGN